MGLSHSKKIVWGPTSANIYTNKNTNKKILFIGDSHSIPSEQPGISLNEMFTQINTYKTIGFITEGCASSSCLLNEDVDNCMKRAQTCELLQHKFTTLWGDYRENTSLYKLEITTKILALHLNQFRFKWNDADETVKKQLSNIIVHDSKAVLASYKTVLALKGTDLVTSVKNQYEGFNKIYQHLSTTNKKHIDTYINTKIGQTELPTKYDIIKGKLLKIIKNIMVSFKDEKYIPSSSFPIYIKTMEDLTKILHSIVDCVFEAYMIMLVLNTNFERYIIHSGSIHTHNIEQYFSNNLGYKLYFSAPNTSFQSVNISGLKFI